MTPEELRNLVQQHAIAPEDLSPEEREEVEAARRYMQDQIARGEVLESWSKDNFPIGLNDDFEPFPTTRREPPRGPLPSFGGRPLNDHEYRTLCYVGDQLCMLMKSSGPAESDGMVSIGPPGTGVRVPDPGGRVLLDGRELELAWLSQQPGSDAEQATVLGLALPDQPNTRLPADQVGDVFVHFHGPQGELRPTFPGPPPYGEVAEPAVRSDPTVALRSLLEQKGPAYWQRIRLHVQGLGTRLEVSASVLREGNEFPWIPPEEAVELLLRLRFCSCTGENGTWTTADIVVVRDGETTINTGYGEPVWRYDDRHPVPTGVSPEMREISFKYHDDGHLREYYDELKHFPRERTAMPAWLLDKAWEYHSRLTERDRTRPSRHLDGYGSGVRAAETFDGRSDDGRPIVYRAALTEVEKQQVLEYLRGGHLVISAYSTSEDWVDPTRPAAVPHVWLTDGPWVWPEAITYYLEAHNISPPPEFLDHIRAAGYRPPPVLPDAALERAQNSLSGGSPHAALPDQARTQQVIAWTRWVIAGLRITKQSYSFQAPLDGAWCMVQDQGGWWSVFRQRGQERTEEVRFHKTLDAATQLLGRLSLDQENIKRPPEEPLEDFEFLIQPMAGEPPLASYDAKQPVLIQPGTDVDRYGEPGGNTVFVAGTAPANRGMRPDQPVAAYHRYRVASPFEVVVGYVRPAPEQGLPGGGQAYVLPQSAHDLVAGGWLAEL